jgi:hypothetical protein
MSDQPTNLGCQLTWIDPARDPLIVSPCADNVEDFLAAVSDPTQ